MKLFVSGTLALELGCRVSNLDIPFSLTCSSLTLSSLMLYAFSSMDSLKSSITSLLHPSATNEDFETLLKAEDGMTSAFSSKYALPTTASRTVKKILIAILPNPIQRRLAPHIYKSPRIHPTSYLDGLRGTCFAWERSFSFLRVAHSKAPSAGVNPCPRKKRTKFELLRYRVFHRLCSPLYQLGATLPGLLWRGY